RRLDEQGQLFLIAIAQLSQRVLTRGRPDAILLPEAFVRGSTDEELRRLVGNLAQIYQELAERLRTLRRLKAAEVMYERAQELFEDLNNRPEAAYTRYRHAILL